MAREVAAREEVDKEKMGTEEMGRVVTREVTRARKRIGLRLCSTVTEPEGATAVSLPVAFSC